MAGRLYDVSKQIHVDTGRAIFVERKSFHCFLRQQVPIHLKHTLIKRKKAKVIHVLYHFYLFIYIYKLSHLFYPKPARSPTVRFESYFCLYYLTSTTEVILSDSIHLRVGFVLFCGVRDVILPLCL